MVDDGGGGCDAQFGHLPQAHASVLGRLEQELTKIGQIAAGFRHTPHHHLEHLLLLEQGPDLEAGKDGGHLPANIAGLEAMAFGRD